mmetsp:Transcript_4551/g.7835  ORF Transcript_4551/g.7835 Transcript_4551/m.7835 type:complete len:91 (-) Transcript_4551:251-523(-)
MLSMNKNVMDEFQKFERTKMEGFLCEFRHIFLRILLHQQLNKVELLLSPLLLQLTSLELEVLSPTSIECHVRVNNSAFFLSWPFTKLSLL